MEAIKENTQITGLNALNSNAQVLRSRKKANTVENPGKAVEKSSSVPAEKYIDVKATPDNEKQIKKAIKSLEIFQVPGPDTRFQFHVHEETGTIQIRLINYATGEVMNEVPSSKLLEYAYRMEELNGIVLEKRA